MGVKNMSEVRKTKVVPVESPEFYNLIDLNREEFDALYYLVSQTGFNGPLQQLFYQMEAFV